MALSSLRRIGAARRRGEAAPRNGEAVVLMYHRVAAPASDLWGLSVTPAHFAEHLEVVKERFRPVALRDLVTGIHDQAVPSRSVAITFDDGYRDNLYAAKPLLELHGIPATVFVATSYIDSTRDFWWDEVEQLLLREVRPRPRDHRALRRDLQRLTPAARLEALDALWHEAGVERPPATGVPTTEEVVALGAGDLVEIGAHTSTHPRLSVQPRHVQESEIHVSKERLQELLGVAIESFSYPHGDYDSRSLQAVREAGFRCACTSEAAPVTARTSTFEIPRMVMDDCSAEELARRLDHVLIQPS